MSKQTKTAKKGIAGAFDIRNVIGGLLGIYGVVLLMAYLMLDPGMNPDTNMPKNISYNLWSGLALVAVALVFIIWAKVRPVIVEEEM